MDIDEVVFYLVLALLPLTFFIFFLQADAHEEERLEMESEIVTLEEERNSLVLQVEQEGGTVPFSLATSPESTRNAMERKEFKERYMRELNLDIERLKILLDNIDEE